MRTLLIAAVLSSAITVLGAEPIKAPPEPADMKTIFNGKDLTGWDGDKQFWTVKDGAIRGETTKEKKSKGNTFIIWTEGETTDFELRVSFRCSTVNNSGIQYRSKRDKPGSHRVRGYQHEIRNSNKIPNVSGFIYDEGGTAGKRGRTCMVGEKAVTGADGKKKVVETLITKEEYEKLFTVDDWNDVIIIAKGNNIKHYMNGRLVLDFTDNHPKALSDGSLAFQLHGGAPMWCEFKNVRFKSLK
jgi:hypothetical protein